MIKCLKKKWGILLLVFVMILAGCATSQYEVKIANISADNIKEIYIKNAGTGNWGGNMVKDLNNLNLSAYSKNVDIKVIDNNNTVYSKNNVPFNEAVFVESGKTTSPNQFASGVLLVGLIVGAIVLFGN